MRLVEVWDSSKLGISKFKCSLTMHCSKSNASSEMRAFESGVALKYGVPEQRPLLKSSFYKMCGSIEFRGIEQSIGPKYSAVKPCVATEMCVVKISSLAAELCCIERRLLFKMG